jgi:hypothetical protein
MRQRLFRCLAAAALLAAVVAGGVNAGGWATITADTANPAQPNAGQPFTLGFTVMQHGITPAGWVHATLLAVDGATGKEVSVKATGQGADGHFVATMTLPTGGYWTWQVKLDELIVETPPQPFAVANADGTRPAMDTGTMLAALERTRTQVKQEVLDQVFAETDGLKSQITGLTSKVTYLSNLLDEASVQRAALAKQVATLSTPSSPQSVPIFAVIAIAVLAGAISGFAMAALGRREPIRATTPTTPVPVEDLAAPGGVMTTR